jgi:hypothetical protein
MKSILSPVLAAGLMACCQCVLAATYYVAPTGSNSNPGTSANPFLTLQAGVNAVRAGDTIIVRDGTYGPTGGPGSMGVTINTSGSASAPITLKAENKGKAILDCRMVCHAYFNFPSASGAYWVIQGFDIRNATNFGIVIYPAGSNNLLIQGNIIHHIGNRVDTTAQGIAGIFTDANMNIVVDGNVIHDVGRTSVLTGAHDHGIYTHGRNMVISNNVFFNARNGWHIQTAVNFSGTIANNTFFGPNPYPGKIGQMVVWDPNGSVLVRNNIFYNPVSYAIDNVGASVSGPCSLDHNIVFSDSGSAGLIDALPSGCTQSDNRLNVDPKLTTPSVPNFNFQLLAGSPAIGAGVALSVVPRDFNGTPRSGRNDAGAFQYGGAIAPPPPPPLPAGCVAGAGAWLNIPLTAQTGFFTLEFDATPGAPNIDGVAGLSNGPASDYTGLAAAVRFNNTGMIDARNGGAYAAAASIPYVSGLTYRIRLVVNIPGRVYSAYARQGYNPERLIGGNYAFRPEQSAPTALSSLGVYSSAGSLMACRATVTASIPPTSVTAVSATAVGPTSATILWTTNNPADSQVQYGPTTAYGVTTTLNAAPLTSHSVSIGGLTPGTLYHYRVLSRDAAGNLAASPDATFTTGAAPSCATSAGAWRNISMPAQTGSFTAVFDGVPGKANIDGVIGLSNGPAADYASLAAAVRFNNTGKIDARNGGAYAAAAPIPYVAGATYRFQLTVNIQARTYSAYVTQGSGPQQVIALNHAFRTEQKAAALLNNLGMFADAGGMTICKTAP